MPPEKLSIKRTQWRSRGTVVPPEVTHTTGRVSLPAGQSVDIDVSAVMLALDQTGVSVERSRQRHTQAGEADLHCLAVAGEMSVLCSLLNHPLDSP